MGAAAAAPVHTRFPNVVSSTEPTGSASQNNNRPEDDANGSSSSDDDLEIIDDALVSTHKSGGMPPQRVIAAPTHPTAPAKRRRVMDPFAGMTPKPEVTHIGILLIPSGYSAGPSGSQTPVANGDEDVTSSESSHQI